MDKTQPGEVAKALNTKIVDKCPTCQHETDRVLLDDGSVSKIEGLDGKKRAVVKLFCSHCGNVQEFMYEYLMEIQDE